MPNPADFPPPERRDPAEPRMDQMVSAPPRAPAMKMIAIGVGAAVALGLVFGLLIKPDFDAGKPRAKPARTAASAPAPASDGQVQIMVTTRAAPAVPTSGGKLETMSGPPLVETLPAQPVRTAAQRTRSADDRNWFQRLFGQDRAAPPPPRRAERPPVPVQPTPVSAPAEPMSRDDESGFEMVEPGQGRMEVGRPAPTPVRAFSPSFNCRYARSRAEQLICADPGLAAADRRLARAYAQAVRAGYPQGALRYEQDRWLRAREQAARYDADAVAEIYEQRTAELEELAAE